MGFDAQPGAILGAWGPFSYPVDVGVSPNGESRRTLGGRRGYPRESVAPPQSVQATRIQIVLHLDWKFPNWL